MTDWRLHPPDEIKLTNKLADLDLVVARHGGRVTTKELSEKADGETRPPFFLLLLRQQHTNRPEIATP